MSGKMASLCTWGVLSISLLLNAIGCNDSKQNEVRRSHRDSNQVSVESIVSNSVLSRGLQQLFADRPGIYALVASDASIIDWLNDQFHGFDTGYEIQWDPNEPLDNQPSAYLGPSEFFSSGLVRISRKYTDRDQLVLLFFELFNNRTNWKQQDNWEQALNGIVLREEYADRALRLEYKAMIATKSFLDNEKKILMGRTNQDQFCQILSSFPDNYDDYLQLMKSQQPGFDPRDYWYQCYEKLIKPRRDKDLNNYAVLSAYLRRALFIDYTDYIK
jgi:hypothetical protein